MPKVKTTVKGADQYTRLLETNLNAYFQKVYGNPKYLARTLMDNGISGEELQVLAVLYRDVFYLELSQRLVSWLLPVLDERRTDMLVRHYGLNSDSKMTLETIGDEYELSRERIRQLEERTMRQLRQPLYRRQFANVAASAAREILDTRWNPAPSAR